MFREPVDRGKHIRKDADRVECLMIGQLRKVAALLPDAQRRPPEQFINPRSNLGVGRIHERTPCTTKLLGNYLATTPWTPTAPISDALNDGVTPDQSIV